MILAKADNSEASMSVASLTSPHVYDKPLPRGRASRGVFEINGIRFPCPPSGISITERNQNFNFETLRTRESTKIRSGRGRFDITVSAIFTGNTTGSVELFEGLEMPSDDLTAINETLMPILYSLKKTPLCFLDNELLRTTLPIVPNEVIGAMCRSVAISTVPSMPFALSVEFQFTWFNHRPYTPRIMFRKDWYDDLKTVETLESMYNSIESGYQKAEGGGDDTGRFLFIKNFGHPSVAFNATASHSFTEDITEARPLLEWLWPYRYQSTNKAVLKESAEGKRSYLERSLSAMPPFFLEGFDHNTTFSFVIPSTPSLVDTPEGKKSVMDIVAKYTTAHRPIPISAEEMKAKAKAAQGTKAPTTAVKVLDTAAKTASVFVPGYDYRKQMKDFGIDVEPLLSPGVDVITTYKMPHGNKKISPEQKAMANYIYTRLIDEGFTPAFAMAAVVQSSFESGLDPTAKRYSKRRKDHTDIGLLQINNVGGLGRPNKDFADGRIGGTAAQAAMNPSKYYNVEDPETHLTRWISFVRSNKQLKAVAKNRNLSPYEAYDALFWSPLGGGVKEKLPPDIRGRFEKNFPPRQDHAIKHVPGWMDKNFNSGGRLPGRISLADVRTVTQSTPLSERYSEVLDGEEAYRIALESSIGEMDYPSLAKLDELASSEIAKDPNSQKAAELRALMMAAQNGWVFVKHAITGKVAQITKYELSIDEFVGATTPMMVSVSFGTNLTMLPLDGHRFATTQYLGGQHTAATISFRAAGSAGRTFVREFQNLVNASEESAINYREFTKKRGLYVTNQLLNSMNVGEVLLEVTQVDTIPGAPDDINVVLRLANNTINEEGPQIMLAIEEENYSQVGKKTLELLVKKGMVGVKFNVSRTEDQPKGSNDYTDKNTVVETYEGGLVLSAPGPKGEAYGANRSTLGLWLDERNSALYQGRLLRRRIQLPDGRYKFIYNDAGDEWIISDDENDPLSYPERVIVRESRTIKNPTYRLDMSLEALGYGPDDLAKTPIEDLVGLSSFGGSYSTEIGDPLERITAERYSEEIGRNINSSLELPRGAFQVLYGDRVSSGFIGSRKFQAWTSRGGRRLLTSLGAPSGNVVRDPDFAALFASSMKGASYQKTNEAYPDLLLPPNPISGLCIDTTPDFFLVNYSDVKLCNPNVSKIINGAGDVSVKARGFVEGALAVDNGHDNLIDIYTGGAGEGLRMANEGRGGIYVDATGQGNAANKGVFKTSEKGLPVDRAASPPSTEGVLISLPGQTPTLQNDIEGRRTNSARYKRQQAIDAHYDQSAYKESLVKQFNEGTPDGEHLENLAKVQHVFNPNTYKEMFKQFTDNYKSEHYAVRRAFPTFKVFFVEEDGINDFAEPESLTGEVFTMAISTPSLDDFYGVNSIKEISITSHKDSPVSTCVIQVMDLDGILYNKKFDAGEGGGAIKDLTGTIDVNGNPVRENKLTDDSNPFFSTMIKEGMKVIVKFGYSNDPLELDTMFVGQIAQFEGTHFVTIVCQSYGAELVAKTFGTDPSKNVDLYNTTSADLVHDTLDREEVRHFGRWRLSDIDLGGELFGHEKLRPDGRVKTVWTWRPSVVDDNVYIPPADEYSSLWARLWGDLHYVFWQTTIWDVFKELELRHPDCIAYPVPYGQAADARMTLFFGHPDMVYLSRPALDKFERDGEFSAGSVDQMQLRTAQLNLYDFYHKNVGGRAGTGLTEEQAISWTTNKIIEVADANPTDVGQNMKMLAEKAGQEDVVFLQALPTMRQTLTKLNEYEDAAKKAQEANSAPGTYLGPTRDYSRVSPDQFYKATVAWQGDRLRQFRNYELITSMNDIIQNKIRTDISESFNSVELHYSSGSVNFGTFGTTEPETLVVNADDNIKEHHIRRTIEAWPNCTTTDLARRYASQLLANSIKRSYRGELLIMGKPRIKPYDVLWMNDTYSDMAGPIEVEEVVHTMSSETGFVTEIVPNMIVSVAGDAKLLMVDAIGKFFNTTAKDFTNGAMLGLSLGAGLGAGVAVFNAGNTIRTVAAATQSTVAKITPNVVSKAATATGNAISKITPDRLKTIAQKVKGQLDPDATRIKPNYALSGTGIVAAGGIEATRQSHLEDSEINAESVGGFFTGLGVAGLATVLPITIGVSAIVAGALLYKFLKYNTTREPVIITPLIKEGKPFILGLEGFETDGLLCTSFDGALNTGKKKWSHYLDGIEEANNIVVTGWNNFWAGD